MNGAEIWSQANDTLAAIKWPAVVAIVVFGFRRQIGDRIRNIRSYKGPGGEFAFNEIAEVRELTESLKDDVGGVIDASLSVDATMVAEGKVVSGEPSESRRPSLLDLRQDIENIIRSSWASGFDAGKSGHYPENVAPAPMIEWRGAVPVVVGFSYSDPGVWSQLALSEVTRNARTNALKRRIDRARDTDAATANEIASLEAEIRVLIHTDHGPADSASNQKARQILDQLQQRLRMLAPDSPYANIRDL